jgi:hypothetical protein
MTTRALGIPVLLGLAVVATQTSCGEIKGSGPNGSAGGGAGGGGPSGGSGGSVGGSPPDGSGCGDPISCVQGGPSGEGFACGDFAMEGTCVGGQWRCPGGMIDTRECTCGAPGVAGCTICTSHGWDCPDAGVDAADAPVDHGTATTDGGRCGRTNVQAAITVHQPDGGELSCSHTFGDAGVGPPTPVEWTGKVAASGSSSVSVLLPCSGSEDAGCVPGNLRVEVTAPDLDLTRFPKVWVRVRAAASRFYACQQALEITTADPLDGSAASEPAGRLLLAVNDGGGALAGAPFKVDRVPLGCSSERGCGSPAPDDYAFDFKSATGDGPAVRVSMGESATWTNAGTSFTVRNLRSFQSVACDDYWNWAYTIYADPK